MSRVLWMFLAVAAMLAPATSFAGAQDLTRLERAQRAAYARQLEQLAKWCDANDLPKTAKATRRWLPDRETGKSYVFLLDSPNDIAQPAVDSGKQRQWWQRLAKLRKARANQLFTMAQKAMAAKRHALAYAWLMEGAREDPNNEKLRRLLGYRKVSGKWRSAYAADKIQQGYVLHPKFGWLRKNDVQAYEKGKRRLRATLVDRDVAAARMRDSIDRGFTIVTEHYKIRTNDTWESGVELGRRLERLYDVWQQVFLRYYASGAEIERLVTGKAGIRRRSVRHDVVYFRNRDQYNQFLRKAQPNIHITLGIYFGDVRTAYFFAGDQQDAGTLHHEATHQLFQEILPVGLRQPKPMVGQRNNFWAVEAIACYMESMIDHGSYCTLGGLDEGRLPAARVRALQDGFYVPLAELVSMGMNQLQRDKRIAKLYSQSSGVAAFLMHYDDAKYREATIHYLRRIYAGRDDRRTLADLTGEDYPTLDRQYREFLQGK